MSKWGVNPKAEEKREREKEKKDAERNKKEQQQQAKKWKDEVTDKVVGKQRDKERERQEELRKREQKRRLVEEEERQMAKISKKGPATSTKLTMAEIAARQAKMFRAQNGIKSDDEDEELDLVDEPLNPNYEMEENQVNARSVNEALGQLDLSRPDKHPEKRVKAAWNMFLEENLPRVKAENPNLKRSQHIMMLEEEWKKSPDNPFNQKTAKYNQKV